MTNIADQVNFFLDSNFVIRKCLAKDITSFRALARHIIKKLSLSEKNLDAVISAIRRYKRDHKTIVEKDVKSAFSKLSVKTRSNVVDICMKKSKRIIESISKINSIVDIEKGEIIRIIQAEESIRIIIDDKNMDKFFDFFNRADTLSIQKNLTEINFLFHHANISNTEGIVSIISSSLTAEGINIIEIMSCAPELIILIRKEDLVKAINIIDNLEKDN